MPVSRFRSAPRCSRTAPYFEQGGWNERRSPRSSPSPGSAGNVKSPPSPSVGPYPTPKRPIRAAWRSLGERAHRKNRLRDPRIEANPDARTAGPQTKTEASARPVSQPRDRSEPRPLHHRTAGENRSLRRDPFRDSRKQGEPRLLQPPDPSRKPKPSIETRSETASGRSRRRLLLLLMLARGAGPSLASEGEPWPEPESSGRGPCRPLQVRGDSRTLRDRHLALPHTTLADRASAPPAPPDLADRPLARSTGAASRRPRVRL